MRDMAVDEKHRAMAAVFAEAVERFGEDGIRGIEDGVGEGDGEFPADFDALRNGEGVHAWGFLITQRRRGAEEAAERSGKKSRVILSGV